MKKMKTALWIIAVLILGLFIYQNHEYFLAIPVLIIKIPLTDKIFHLPQLPNGIMFLICILIGFLAAYILNLLCRFKHNKEIKALNETIEKHIATITELENQIKLIKQEFGPIENESENEQAESVNHPDQEQKQDADSNKEV